MLAGILLLASLTFGHRTGQIGYRGYKDVRLIGGDWDESKSLNAIFFGRIFRLNWLILSNNSKNLFQQLLRVACLQVRGRNGE